MRRVPLSSAVAVYATHEIPAPATSAAAIFLAEIILVLACRMMGGGIAWACSPPAQPEVAARSG